MNNVITKEKIALFIETGGPGGAERVVFILASALRRTGVDVFVITLRTGWLTEALDRAGISRFQIKSERRDFLLPLKLRSLLKREKATILHSHLLDSNFYGAFAARLAGIPHVGTEHGDVHHSDAKKLLSLKIKFISLLGTKLIAVSNFTSRALLDLGYSGNLTVIENPIETSRFTPLPSEGKLELRASLNIPAEVEWVWLHVANLRPVKDQGTLLRGFAESVKSGFQNQMLLIVGDGEELDSLVQLTKDMQIEGFVRFIGYKADPVDYFHAADGFILSSLSEALPISILEAAASKLLVIASAVGGLPDLITSDRGLLFPKGDFIELGRKISTVLSDLSKTEGLKKQFQEFVLHNCSESAVVEKHLAIYQMAHRA